MSGIAGIIRFGGAVAENEVQTMLNVMVRRGPDRQTWWCEGNAGFGQVLLATTPEATVERQPWKHPDSGCIVVSDSRLDNRPELLRELGITRAVDEVGDGELLHAAWQRWREGCADRLRGDFAFAIWHPSERELFLARDPMGVRPLQFHFDRDRLFVFGSSTEAVLAQGQVPATLDEGRIADALIGETEGIDQVCTFFTTIQRLPPAHWMRLRDGSLVQQRYWRPVADDRPTGLPTTEPEWIEAQRERLDRAVRQRLRSHRPVGSMLSGGLDSSAVVALAGAERRVLGLGRLPVYSAINSADPECLETRAIRAVADHVYCSPTFIDLPEFSQSRTRVHQLWEEAGEPFDGTMALVATLYDSAAGQGVRCLLDGLPADNLYSIGRRAKYLFDQGRWSEAWTTAVAQWRRPWVRFPRLHALRVMAGCAAPDIVHHLRNRVATGSEYRELLRSSLASTGLVHKVDLKHRYRRYRKTIGDSHLWHRSGNAMSSLAAPYITAAVERYNRVASLYAVEPRHPYADRDLIEFQAWVPMELRHHDGHLKWMLREAMTGLLPPAVAWRRDKNHLGWHFSRVLLQAASMMGIMPTEPIEASWLDAQRLSSAGRHPMGSAATGLPAALMLLLWRKRIGQLQPSLPQ